MRTDDPVQLSASDADDVVTTLVEAFTDYPVMTFVLGDDRSRDGLHTLVRMFTMARVLRGEPMLGVWQEGELVAAAIASDPHGAPAPEAFRALRAEVWRTLGAEAEARYDRYGEATRAFGIEAPHVHLNMVGVRRAYQRRGLGGLLIDAVQDISRARPASAGVSLTTEDPENVAYYLRLGFRITGHAEVGPGLESWGFFRPD